MKKKVRLNKIFNKMFSSLQKCRALLNDVLTFYLPIYEDHRWWFSEIGSRMHEILQTLTLRMLFWRALLR